MARKLALCAPLFLLALACHKRPGRIDEAFYKDYLPVYPGATFDSRMGGRISDLDSSAAISEGMSWFYTTNAPPEKVIAFYVKALAEEPKQEDGETTFKITPAGADSLDEDSKEEVHVVVSTRDGLTRIQLGEQLKPGKHRW
jgi:hypothetical protein